MEFEYRPQDFKEDCMDYQKYFLAASPMSIFFTKCILISFFALIIFYIVIMSDLGYEFLLCWESPMLFGSYLIYVLFVYFVTKAKDKKKKLDKRVFKDINKNYKITIKDNFIIRESELSTFTIPFSEIDAIKTLDKGVIIKPKGGIVEVFIPKSLIKGSIEEFLTVFNGYSIKVEDCSKAYDNYSVKVQISFFVAIVIGILLACLSIRYNFSFR